MANYVSQGTQTEWAGLTQREIVRPEFFLSPPRDTTTPPDEMITDKVQFVHGVPHILQPMSPPSASLLERRQNRAGLNPHISLPAAKIASHELNDEVPLSPPTTRALLSPLPEANKRHAGHTPLIPRALSPEPDAAVAEEEQAPAEDKVATPDVDEALSGALTLPTNPVDGSDESHFGLDALDKVLSKIERQQKELRGEFDDDTPAKSKPSPELVDGPTEDGLPLSRKGSADSHRSNATEAFDGVILKSPPSNFGAPLGSLKKQLFYD
jgi:hypothetical protein